MDGITFLQMRTSQMLWQPTIFWTEYSCQINQSCFASILQRVPEHFNSQYFSRLFTHCVGSGAVPESTTNTDMLMVLLFRNPHQRLLPAVRGQSQLNQYRKHGEKTWATITALLAEMWIFRLLQRVLRESETKCGKSELLLSQKGQKRQGKLFRHVF